ncbi:hypothetical protein [Actinosynnema sp. NPDC020468]|uniref:hypothetical protein n=1 Tax=Actinosynnema sp. NPDC020468 TaxID=3154488 RepID=UPI0033FF509E
MTLRLLVLAVLLAGCGASAQQPGAGTATPSDPTQASEETTVPGIAPKDTGFPIDAKPRPIVLVGSPLVVDKGFHTDAEKADVGRGGFTFVGTPPKTPDPQDVQLPDGQVKLSLISALDAVRAMSVEQVDNPVKLVKAEEGTYEFLSDRGKLALPSWRFTTESGTELVWPAPVPEAFWGMGINQPSTSAPSATESGSTLEVVMESAPSPCPGDQPATAEPVVHESDKSVIVSVKINGEVGDCPRDLALHTQAYQVKLAKPLGARLLLDTGGGVVPVTKR